MLLTIIVPVFNTEAYLARCIDSLLAHGMNADDIEIIVVNDGSEDGSLRVAQAYAANHASIVIHSQPNEGLSAARNAGLRMARGRFIYFVDSDDYVASSVLADIIALMVREDLQALTFEIARPNDDDGLPDPRWPFVTPSQLRVVSGVEYLADRSHTYYAAAWAFIYERQFLLDVGIRFEVGRILEDLVFTSTTVAAATRVAYVPADVYRYVRRPGSIMETRGRDSIRRVTDDWGHAIAGLDELRRDHVDRGTEPVAFMDRLEEEEQKIVFFLIARFIRSGVPLSPMLSDALVRFRALGIYPLDKFPTADFRGVHYRLLRVVFNRPWLLRPFATAVRAVDRGRRLRSSPGLSQ